MDKRTVLFIILSFVVLLGWQILFGPKPEEPAVPGPGAVDDARGPEAGADRVPSRGEEDLAPEYPAEEAEPPPEPAQSIVAEAEQTVTAGNDLLEATFTNLGARVKSWKVREYTGPDGGPQELIPCFVGDAVPLPLALDFDDPVLSEEINAALFRAETEPVYAADGRPGGERIRFQWADGRGLEVEKSLTFRQGEYLVDMEVSVRDRGRHLPVRVTWGPGFAAEGAGNGGRISSYYNYRDQALWNLGGRVTRARGGKLDEGAVSGPLLWAGLEDQYFAALMIPESDRSMVRVWKRSLQSCTEEGEEPAEAQEQPIVSVSFPDDGAGLLYVGPKKYTLLRGLGHELGRAVWFSTYELLRVIARWLFLALIWIHNHIVPNYGLAIILATVALRIVLFPLNQYSMVKMRKAQVEMQRLQPKINAIKKKFQKKKDAESRAAMNREMMALYQKEGVSPMGGVVGCLPMLAQFPILIGFYNMLTVAIELRGAPFFGWIHDLSVQDPIYVIPILMGVTMFAQQKLSQGKVTDPMQKQQQKIMMFMPIFFTYICVSMPSGMVLYWFVNNLLGIGQQWLVNRHTGKLAAAPQTA